MTGTTPGGASALADGSAFAGGWPGLLRPVVTMAVLAALVWVAQDRLDEIDGAAVAAALRGFGPADWVAGLGAGAASFLVVGAYERAVHRHLGTGVAPGPAGRAGMAAIAVSQTAGFGLVTGTLVRWRLLPGMTLAGAARLTLAVSGSLLAGWLLLSLAALAVWRMPLPGLPDDAGPALAMALVTGCALLLVAGRVTGRRLPVPPAPLHLVWAVIADGLVSAAAFWVFLPPDVAFSAVFPAFLLALGAGLVLGTPGGLGGFELTLAACLPAVADADLLAAVLAFRVVYHLVPALLATGLLIAGRRGQAGASPPATPVLLTAAQAGGEPGLMRAVGSAAKAETGLLRQGQLDVLRLAGGCGGWLALRRAGMLAAVLDPFGAADAVRGIPALRAAARRAGAAPCLYKAGPRTAGVARRDGFAVVAISEEKWLDPARFDPAAPALSRLRRKLRHAARAGIRVDSRPARAAWPLPEAEMTTLSADWAVRHGGERGLTMGRYHPGYVDGQHVWLAHHQGRLVAFVTFHAGPREWTLDLMRSAPGIPDGTMHTLVATAIAEAKAAGVPRLSLAAVPVVPATLPRPLRALLARIYRRAGTEGLRQFKDSFAPSSRNLYLAAPRLMLPWCAAMIAGAIRHPPPLAPARPSAGNSDDMLANPRR